MLIIITQIHFIEYIWNCELNWFAFPHWKIIYFFCGELSLFTFNLTIIIYAHACLLIVVFGVASLVAMNIKLNQIRQLLYSKYKHTKMPTRIEYQTFLKLINQSMQIFHVGNYSLGMTLFVYVIVNGPISCLLMAALLNNNTKFNISFTFVLLYAFHQLLGIFGIHVLVVTLNKNLHRPVKRMIHLSIHDRKLTKISRLKMKIHNYNVAFHTKKKYGITYASFGLITMSSFFKVSYNFKV